MSIQFFLIPLHRKKKTIVEINMITILIQLKKTEKILGYGYYHIFHGYVSELLGNEKYGEQSNDYVYSNICGGRCTVDGFVFPNNPYFYIRTNNDRVWNNFLENINNKKNIMNGFTVEGFTIVDTKLSGNTFETDAASPILLSKKYKKMDVLSHDDLINAEEYLINTVKKKAEEVGFEIDPNLSIMITLQRKHRDIMYRGVINKGRNLKLRINCNDKTKEFILINGLGRSTGCGFGFLI